MREKTKWIGLLAAIAVVFITAIVVAHDENKREPFFKIGKDGQVSFNTDVRIGSLVLRKGKYSVQHRMEAGDHVFVFTDLKTGRKTASSAREEIVIRSKGVFPGDKSGEPGIHGKQEKDRSVRITKIEVAGENLDHTF